MRGFRLLKLNLFAAFFLAVLGSQFFISADSYGFHPRRRGPSCSGFDCPVTSIFGVQVLPDRPRSSGWSSARGTSLTMDDFRSAGVLTEGGVSLRYNGILFPPTGGSEATLQNGINVSVRSRLGVTCLTSRNCLQGADQRNPYNAARNRVDWLPFEMTFRSEFGASQDPAFFFQNIRIGIANAVIESIGLTARAGMYAYQDRLAGQGVSHQLELGGLEIREIVSVFRNGTIALMVSGYFHGGIGSLFPSSAANQTAAALSGQPDSVLAAGGNGHWMQTGITGGVQLFQRLLATVYTNYETQTASGYERNAAGLVGNTDFFRLATTTVYGGAIRYQVTRELAAEIFMQTRDVARRFTYHDAASGAAVTRSEEQRLLEGGLGVIWQWQNSASAPPVTPATPSIQ